MVPATVVYVRRDGEGSPIDPTKADLLPGRIGVVETKEVRQLILRKY